MERTSRKLNKDVLYPSIIIFSVLLLLLFVCPFSPIHRYCFETDEVAYRLVSKGLLKGKIPYRDLFDHKGPLLYFVYAFGMLITGGSDIGIWIVFSLINAASFYLLYKTARLFFDEDSSFMGLMITIALLNLHSNSLFVSGTKPEHIVLLFLSASQYLFFKRITERKEKPVEEVFSGKDMLILGLLCGGIFLLKMNFCIYYLCFLGLFFLYQLIRKKIKVFFTNAVVFISGIVLSCLPFVAFFCYHGAMDDLIDCYFTFNMRYASKAGYDLFYFRPWIQFEAKVAINILFILAIVAFTSAFLKAKEGSNTRKQLGIYVLCGFVVIAFITLPLIYRYVLTTLVPLLMWGPCFLGSAIRKRFPKNRSTVITSSVASALIVFFIIQIMCIQPLIPMEKPELEIRMEEYSQAFPDSTYMYYGNLCYLYFYDMTTAVPDFKYFYVPNFDRARIVSLQGDDVRSSTPDVLTYRRTEDLDDEFMDKLGRAYAKCGYELYVHDETVYVYIRKAHYDALMNKTQS